LCGIPKSGFSRHFNGGGPFVVIANRMYRSSFLFVIEDAHCDNVAAAAAEFPHTHHAIDSRRCMVGPLDRGAVIPSLIRTRFKDEAMAR
jgi:hypothetical protein